MLREIFRTVIVPYRKAGDIDDRSLFGLNYNANKPPYQERLYWWSGLHVGRNPTPDSPTSIYLFGTMHINQWPGWGFGFWRFDGKSGKFIKRMWPGSSLGVVLSMNTVNSSRNGVCWAKNHYQTTLIKILLGATATAYVDDEPEDDDSWTTAPESEDIHASHFKNLDGTDAFYGFGTAYAIDDAKGVFINGSFRDLWVFHLGSGMIQYKLEVTDNIVAICFEDDSRCYVLMGNQVVFLFDYVRNEILGYAKIPSLRTEGESYWNNGDVRMAWDPVFRRLLVIEVLPDDPTTGACTCYVRGFRNVPMPVRLTTPIPLKAPRQGRQIPVLVQAVGDLNEGCGGYVINARVTGAGMLMGVPISNHVGDTIIQVLCANADTPYDYDVDYDYGDTGSNPINVDDTLGQWDVKVVASAIVYSPDPADVPVSGTGAVGAGGGFAGGPQPGPPGGGGETGGGTDYGPKQMPNLFYIVEEVSKEMSPLGTPWRLNDPYEHEKDGRGAFTGICVQRMHDKDARFGHFNKTPPHNRYEGHAVDAVCFKNDDGVTSEGADIVAGGGKISWQHYDRGPRIADGKYNCWIYPANAGNGTGH